MTAGPVTDVKDLARKLLNIQGHGFQARVLSACHGFAASGGTWLLRSAEVPVQLHGTDFHIDGVLDFDYPLRTDCKLLAAIECKKADPKLRRWCFFRTVGFPPRTVATEVFRWIGQGVRGIALYPTGVRYLGSDQPVAELGLELTANATGDGTGKVLEKAVNQALRGAAGLAQIWPDLGIPQNQQVTVVPVVVTTADLFTASVDLSTADPATGEVAAFEVTPVPWLWLRVNATPSLIPETVRPRPDHDLWYSESTLANFLATRHARAVVIATSAGLPAALEAIPVSGVL